MGAVEDKEHEGGAAGWELTGHHALCGAQPLAGRDVWAGFRHLERTVTIHRGAAAAGEAETINNSRDTPFVRVSLLYLLYYYRRTIWGRRAVG